jgi:hypothetical protein
MMEYADGTRVQLEVRGLYTNTEDGMTMGLLVFGSEGWMRLQFARWAIFYGRKNEPGEHREMPEEKDTSHFANFIDCVRSRKQQALAAPILEGHYSTSMCHLSNIAFRSGRQVIFDSSNENFPGDDLANSYLTREYRYPFVVPDKI